MYTAKHGDSLSESSESSEEQSPEAVEQPPEAVESDEKSKTNDPDYQPVEDENDPHDKTPDNMARKTVSRKNLVKDFDCKDMSQLTEIQPPGPPLAESTRNQPHTASSQPQSSQPQSSQSQSSQNDSKVACKIVKEFLARKTLPVDWIYINGEIKDLNDKNSTKKGAKPLYVEFDHDHDLDKLKMSSKSSDALEDFVPPRTKDTFRELLRRHNECFRLVKIGKNHLKTLNNNYRAIDNPFQLDTKYWFLQFVQVAPIIDETIQQKKDKFNQTTGNHLI